MYIYLVYLNNLKGVVLKRMFESLGVVRCLTFSKIGHCLRLIRVDCFVKELIAML